MKHLLFEKKSIKIFFYLPGLLDSLYFFTCLDFLYRYRKQTLFLSLIDNACSAYYCRAHNVRVRLYIAYIACGSASLYIKTLYFFFCTLALSVAATVANIKIRYDAKTPQFAIYLEHVRVICVFYSIR